MLSRRVLNVQNIACKEQSFFNISTNDPDKIFHQPHIENCYQQNKLFFQNIEQSTYLIIDGDGLLGCSHSNALKLLTIAYITKKHCNKPTYIINLSLSQDRLGHTSFSNNTYIQFFSCLDGISTQDSTSDNFLTQANISHNTGFSLIPLYIENNFPLTSIEKENSIVISGVHLFNNSTLTNLTKYIKYMSKNGVIVKLLLNTDSELSNPKVTFLQSLLSTSEKNWEFIFANDVNTWLYTLAQTNLLISCQHSDIIAASYLNTPAITLGASLENINFVHQLDIPSPPFELTTESLTVQLIQKTIKILQDPCLFLPPKIQLDALKQSSKTILEF